MKQWVVAVVLCACALVVAGVAVSVADNGEQGLAPAAAQGDDDARPGDRGDGHPGRGHGPPPWAHEGDRGDRSEKGDKAAKAGKPWKAGKASKQWKSRWQGLSEAERAELMADLAREHADGMREWAGCVASGDEGCERPLPPGQAKRLQPQ